jgi:hypothetical protein
MLRARQRYFCLLAIPGTTLRFNRGLRPAMGLRRMSLAANHVAGAFFRDSQGVFTKNRETTMPKPPGSRI